MNKQSSNDEISVRELFTKIKDWFSYILSKWIIIVVVCITGSAIGLAYALNQKVLYTASLSFALEDQQQGGGISGALGLASQFGFDVGGTGGGIFSGSNLIELFKSRSMVEQTLLSSVTLNNKTISFAEMYIQNAGWRSKWVKITRLQAVQLLPNANREKFSRIQDSILGVVYQGILVNNLKVEQKDKKTDIITIEVKSENENFAKFFTEALAKEVSLFYISTKTRKAKINLDILERQTDSIRNELNAAIMGVALANDNTFSLNPALNVRRTPSARRQVDVQANTAILTELIKQTELAKVVLRKETPLIQVIDKPIFPLNKEKFGKAKGIIIGGLLAFILILLSLISRRIFKRFY